MRHLFGRSGEVAFAGLMQQKPLLGFDFDGTLAALVERPSLARLAPVTFDRLSRLAAAVPVVVISGRAVSDLAPRLDGIPLAGVSGNHGLEPWGATPEVEQLVRSWDVALAHRFGQVPGLEIDNKRWSLTVDYRHVPDLSSTEKALTTFARTLPQVRVLGGRHADLNLAPAGEHHKGTALARHVTALGRGAALFVGDDRTDEDAFAQPIAGLVSVRVGQKAGSHAQFFLQEQPEVDRLLDALIALATPDAR
jgi:trehalose 6-phosphate phosphatase